MFVKVKLKLCKYFMARIIKDGVEYVVENF